MAGKAIVIYDPVSKDEIELTDKESKQYQEILNTAIQLEESHNKVVAEIQEDYKKFLKRNEQHYKKYKELEAELKKGKSTTDCFTSIDNLSYNTIQTELIQSQDKIAAAESENNLEVTKHKEVLEKFQGTVVHRHKLEKAKVEYNRIKEDIDRSKLIVATLKQQVKKPPHHITEVSLAYLQRDLKKYQYHTNLLEERRAKVYADFSPKEYECLRDALGLITVNKHLNLEKAMKVLQWFKKSTCPCNQHVIGRGGNQWQLRPSTTVPPEVVLQLPTVSNSTILKRRAAKKIATDQASLAVETSSIQSDGTFLQDEPTTNDPGSDTPDNIFNQKMKKMFQNPVLQNLFPHEQTLNELCSKILKDVKQANPLKWVIHVNSASKEVDELFN